VVLGVSAPGAVTAAVGTALATLVVGPALVVGGGAAAMLYWRKIKRDANAELDHRLDALQKSYHDAMLDLTNRERSRLLQYGQQFSRRSSASWACSKIATSPKIRAGRKNGRLPRSSAARSTPSDHPRRIAVNRRDNRA
jgi:hypothetical protein